MEVAGRSVVLILTAVALAASLLPLLLETPGVAASSHRLPREPIRILGDGNFTPANGVTGGSGTPEDPYRIEGWEIDATSTVDVEVPAGIEVRDTTASFIIRDVYVHSGILGIFLRNVTEAAVEGSALLTNNVGIALVRSRNVVISENNASLNRDGGIAVTSESDGITVKNNTVWNNGRGIHVSFAINITLSDNWILNNMDAGVVRFASNITLSRNFVANNKGGMALSNSFNVTLTGNILVSSGVFLAGESLAHFNSHAIGEDNLVNGRPLRYHKNCADVTLDAIETGQAFFANCTNVRVANTTIANTALGIQMAFVRGATIENSSVSATSRYAIEILRSSAIALSGSVISSSPEGLLTSSSSDLVVSDNTVSGTESAIHLQASSGLVIAQNTLTENGNGVVLDVLLLERVSGDANISGNTISNNTRGIHLIATSGVSITGNLLQENGVGVQLQASDNVLAYHNDLLDNGVQALDDRGPRNRWHGGYPAGGNHWSDYTGVDACSGAAQDVCPDRDGIGDELYVLDADSVDAYPLMVPFRAPKTPPWAAFTVEPPEGAVTTAFLFDASSSADSEDPADSLEVRWDWEDDGVWDTNWSSEKTAQHRFAEPGTYTVRVEVRDSIGLTNGTTRRILVLPGSPGPPLAPIVAILASFIGWLVFILVLLRREKRERSG